MSEQQPDLFDPDICRNRHRGNPESIAAHERLLPVKAAQRREVLEAIDATGSTGLTCRELSHQWGVGMNCISGRFTELHKGGRIRKIGVRDHCGIYVTT